MKLCTQLCYVWIGLAGALHPVVAMFGLAWLVSSESDFRQMQLGVAFAKDLRRRRRTSLHTRAADVVEMYRGTLEDGEDMENSIPQANDVLCLLSVRPLWAYDHLKVLPDEDRFMYTHWTHQCGVDAKDLWCFEVVQLAEVSDKVPLSIYVSRTTSKVWKKLEAENATALMRDVGTPRMRRLVLDNGMPEGFAPTLCFALPDIFADWVRSGALNRFLVPSPFASGVWKTPAWFRRILNDNLSAAFNGTQNLLALHKHSVFKLSDMQSLADSLRRVIAGDQTVADLIEWVVKLQTATDMLRPATTRLKVPVVALVHLVLYTTLLKDGRHLENGVRGALKIALPEQICNGILEACEDALSSLPHVSKVSRFRLSFDVGYMVMQRLANAFDDAAAARCRYLMWDSSPQYHRDYELALVDTIDSADLVEASKLAQRIFEAAADAEILSDEAKQTAHQRDVDALGAMIRRHALPCSLIGFGSCSFAHKVAALLHAMRLELVSHSVLAKYCGEFLTILSDDGTESLLSRVRPLNIELACPHFVDTAVADLDAVQAALRKIRAARGDQAADEFDGLLGDAPGFHLDGEDHGGDEFVFEEAEAPHADFSGVLGMSGVHHIIDNATAGFADVLVDWADHIRQAKAVCKILRRGDYFPKLLSRCYCTPLGRQMHPILKTFQGWIHEGRWGTIAFTVPELLRLKGALRWGWNKDIFLQGDGDAGRDPVGNGPDPHVVQDADAAISSEYWWSWLLMLDKLCVALRAAIVWSEACPCHAGLLANRRHDELPNKLVHAVRSCPLRGRRGPEISAGELLEVVQRSANASSVDLAMELPAGLAAEKRLALLEALDAGHIHATFYIGCKLHYMRELPWAIFQIAHFNKDVCTAAIRRCLDSRHPHPLL